MVGFAMQDQVEPSSGRGPTTAAKLSPTRARLIIRIACPVLLAAIILAALFLASPSAPKPVIYKGKSLEAWFYGSRKDFFMERTRRAAQEAIDGLGTNAFPFLVFTLKKNRGNGAIYFKAYRALPAQMQAKLPYPISGDDVKAITLDHIRQMRERPMEAAQTLADCVPGFYNPRVRMIGFNLVLRNYQTDPAFLKLCRKLLSDAHSGIQLQAAIYLAQSAIRSDPGEPRLFPILLAALESRQQRKATLDLESYRYQQPPGSPGRSAPILPPQFSRGLADPDEVLRTEIMRALDRLERYLTEEQKNQLKQIERMHSREPGFRNPLLIQSAATEPFPLTTASGSHLNVYI